MRNINFLRDCRFGFLHENLYWNWTISEDVEKSSFLIPARWFRQFGKSEKWFWFWLVSTFKSYFSKSTDLTSSMKVTLGRVIVLRVIDFVVEIKFCFVFASESWYFSHSKFCYSFYSSPCSAPSFSRSVWSLISSIIVPHKIFMLLEKGLFK